MEIPYKDIFEESPGYLTVQDKNLKVIAANNRFKRDFGDFENRYCYQVYKQRPEQCDDCPVIRTFRDGATHNSEEEVRCLDGRSVHVIVYTRPVYNAKGEIEAVIEKSTDITELKDFHRRLKESQERYRLLFEESPCYISIQDRDLNIVDSNRMFREDFGTGYGKKCYEVYKHRTEECFPCMVHQTFIDGEKHEHEEVVTSLKGDQINVLVITAPIRDSEGNITNVLEMSANITQIRQLQSQLTSIGLLISSISHGLKGLLNGLDGGIYLVNSGMEKDNPERLNKGWEIVLRNINRIRSMVLDILYYAKDREPEYEKISTTELFEEVCDLMDRKVSDHDIELIKEMDDDSGNIDADHMAVRTMLVNLFENSIDACRIDKRKDNHSVTFSLMGDQDWVYYELMDNGIGMDTETKDKAFSLFFSSKGTEGTGLGLFISNKIAQSHGGTICIDSVSGQGTKFTVKLPRHQPSAPPDENMDCSKKKED